MSFVAVQAVWAAGSNCTEVVSGEVTEVLEHSVVVDGDYTVYGISTIWVDINEGDYVVINAFVSPEGKLVACYLTINGGEVIELRVRTPK
jgi:glyoxylate utilization-related uncharacterized protein